MERGSTLFEEMRDSAMGKWHFQQVDMLKSAFQVRKKYMNKALEGEKRKM